jgi:hypothetical protein
VRLLVALCAAAAEGKRSLFPQVKPFPSMRPFAKGGGRCAFRAPSFTTFSGFLMFRVAPIARTALYGGPRTSLHSLHPSSSERLQRVITAQRLHAHLSKSREC